MILFDGFESEGAYEIGFSVIRPHMPPVTVAIPGTMAMGVPAASSQIPAHQQSPQMPPQMPPPAAAGAGASIMALLGEQAPRPLQPPPPTSLADLEEQLLSSSPAKSAGANIMAMLGQGAPPPPESPGGAMMPMAGQGNASAAPRDPSLQQAGDQQQNGCYSGGVSREELRAAALARQQAQNHPTHLPAPALHQPAVPHPPPAAPAAPAAGFAGGVSQEQLKAAALARQQAAAGSLSVQQPAAAGGAAQPQTAGTDAPELDAELLGLLSKSSLAGPALAPAPAPAPAPVAAPAMRTPLAVGVGAGTPAAGASPSGLQGMQGAAAPASAAIQLAQGMQGMLPSRKPTSALLAAAMTS